MYCNNLKKYIGTPEIVTVTDLNWQVWFTMHLMHPKDVFGMADGVEYDVTAS